MIYLKDRFGMMFGERCVEGYVRDSLLGGARAELDRRQRSADAIAPHSFRSFVRFLTLDPCYLSIS